MTTSSDALALICSTNERHLKIHKKPCINIKNRMTSIELLLLYIKKGKHNFGAQL